MATDEEMLANRERLNRIRRGEEADPTRPPSAQAPEAENQFFGGSEEYFQQTRDAQARAAHQAGRDAQADRAYQQQARGQQQTLADALAMRASGQGGPSIAEQQLQMGQDAALQNALSMARGQRGNQALAMRQAQQQGGQLQAQTNAQAAMLRAQEQQAAEASLGQLLAGMRGQDLGSAQMGLGAQQGMMGLTNQLGLGQAGLNQGTSLANLQSQNQGLDRAQQQRQFDEQMAMQRQQQIMSLIGGLVQGGASLGTAGMM